MAIARKTIGDILVGKNLVTQEQLQQALDVQKSTPSVDIGKILVDLQFAAEVDVYAAKAEADGLPFIDLNKPQA